MTSKTMLQLNLDSSNMMKNHHFCHRSSFEPLTYVQLFGTIPAKLDELRTVSLAKLAKKRRALMQQKQGVQSGDVGNLDCSSSNSEEEEDDELNNLQSYSLTWFWQKTAMYRDIVHQLVKPRMPYTFFESLPLDLVPQQPQQSSNDYRFSATPVKFFVCESDETFHFLLNYMEVELGPDANTLVRSDYRHILFVDEDSPLQSYFYGSTNSKTQVDLFYFPEESQHPHSWRRQSEKHGAFFAETFYTLWEQEVKATKEQDNLNKSKVLKDIQERKRGYLRRGRCLEDITEFLEDQRELREVNENHPTAFVFLTTSMFMNFAKHLKKNEHEVDGDGYSLCIINDGSYGVFDARYSMQASKSSWGSFLRKTISLQFPYVHILSSTTFVYMTFVVNFHNPQLYQRYMPLSVFLMLLSIKEGNDAWYTMFDLMIADAFYPIDENVNMKHSDVLISSFRLSMIEWQRRKVERETRQIIDCLPEKEELLKEEKEQLAHQKDARFYDSHFRPEYKEQINNLQDHTKACKFFVNDFVKCLSSIFETSLFIPIYVQLLMRMRCTSSLPSSEMFQLFMMPGYDMRNGYSLEQRYANGGVHEHWDLEFQNGVCTPEFVLQEEKRVEQEVMYDVFHKADSWMTDPSYRKIQHVNSFDPAVSASQLFGLFRTVHKSVETECMRDPDLLAIKRTVQDRLDTFSLDSAKRKAEKSLRTAMVMNSAPELSCCSSGSPMDRHGVCTCSGCNDNGFTAAVQALNMCNFRSYVTKRNQGGAVGLNNCPSDDVLQICACTERECNMQFCEAVRITLTRLNHPTEMEYQDAVLISKLFKNRDRESQARDVDHQFMKALRLMRYVDADFTRQMYSRRGEICQMACRPSASYQAPQPMVMVNAYHVPKEEMNVPEILRMCCLLGKTLVICSDDLESEVIESAMYPRSEKVDIYTQSLFCLTMSATRASSPKAPSSPCLQKGEKDDDNDDDDEGCRLELPEYAAMFDRVVFVSLSEDWLPKPFSSMSDFMPTCEGCSLCDTIPSQMKSTMYCRNAMDRFLEEDRVLEFFHCFFRNCNANSSPFPRIKKSFQVNPVFRHVWTFHPFSEEEKDGTNIPEFAQTWRLPVYGNFDMDWMVAMDRIRTVDDLVLKLLWACRVPREKSTFSAHFPKSRYQEFHLRKYLELDSVICQQTLMEQKELQKMSMNPGKLAVEKINEDGKKKQRSCVSMFCSKTKRWSSPSSSTQQVSSPVGCDGNDGVDDDAKPTMMVNEEDEEFMKEIEERAQTALLAVKLAKDKSDEQKLAFFECIKVLLREHQYLWKQNRLKAEEFFQTAMSFYRPYYT